MIRLFYFFLYVFIFLRELVKSNIEVAMLALSPRPRFRPGFLAVPIKCKTDFEITSLANSITLTPGTITVHVERDHHLFVIHALNIGDDPDALRQGIATVLEANILKWTRGPGQAPTAPDDTLGSLQGDSA
jgi:multicomponent Na+:H+ antiporter subunit E